MNRSLSVVLFTLILLSVGCASWRNDPAASAVTPKTTVEADSAEVATAAPAAVPQTSAAPIPNAPPPAKPTAQTAPPQARSMQLTAEERDTRANAVDVHTDRGRAFGRAWRPENLKEGQYFVVAVTDNLYGTTLQLAADGISTEVIPHDGKIGRFESGKRVFVATRKAGATKPPAGVPDKLWDYNSICTPECGCQPVDLVAWQLNDPPPLMKVTYDEVLELMKRMSALEERVDGVETDVRGVKKDVAKIKELAVQTSPITRFTPPQKGASPLMQLGGVVSGGRGDKVCKMIWGSETKELQAVIDAKDFGPSSEKVQVLSVQTLSGLLYQQQFTVTNKPLRQGSVVAACQDESGIAFGKPLGVPSGRSVWTTPWPYLGAAALIVGGVLSRGHNHTDTDHGHPGGDPLPLSTPTTNSTASLMKEGARKIMRPSTNAMAADILSDHATSEELATNSEIPVFAQSPASMRKMTQIVRHLVVDINLFAPKAQRSLAVGVSWSW